MSDKDFSDIGLQSDTFQLETWLISQAMTISKHVVPDGLEFEGFISLLLWFQGFSVLNSRREKREKEVLLGAQKNSFSILPLKECVMFDFDIDGMMGCSQAHNTIEKCFIILNTYRKEF